MKTISMDFRKKQFTLTIDPKEAIGPNEVLKAVPDVYTVSKILVSGLVGTVARERDLRLFLAVGNKLKYRLSDRKGKNLLRTMKDGKRYRIHGEASEVWGLDRKSKKAVKVLKLVVSHTREFKPRDKQD